MTERASDLRLVADIGGTRARFALVADQGELRHEREFKTCDFESFEDAAAFYLKALGPGAGSPNEAALAFAGPPGDIAGEGRAGRLTNAPWVFDDVKIGKALGLKSLRLFNDFEAQAHALVWLRADEVEQIGGGPGQKDGNRLILGPGTGLGAAAMVRDHETAERFIAVSGEGGHMTLGATSDEEADLLARLRRVFAHVSAERVLSGAGLEALYLVLHERDGGKPLSSPPRAAEIAKRAEAGDDVAQETLRHFAAFLGITAGDLALIFWAEGGVYLSGGILRRLGPAFDRKTFCRRFQAKGRFSDRLAALPLFLVTHPDPGLLGLAKVKIKPS